MRQWAEEGRGSDAGSLSSIVSSDGSEGEVDTHVSNVLARMGDRYGPIRTQHHTSDDCIDQ